MPMAWLLAWAMVLAPLLGQMHRVVHLGNLAGQASHVQQPAVQPAAAQPYAAQPASDWVHALFDGHGPAGCQLLDQHHHELAGPPSLAPLPFIWAVHAVASATVPVRDGRMLAAFFHARAPPTITAAITA